jgi:hypothetical protein
VPYDYERNQAQALESFHRGQDQAQVLASSFVAKMRQVRYRRRQSRGRKRPSLLVVQRPNMMEEKSIKKGADVLHGMKEQRFPELTKSVRNESTI